MWSTIAVYRSNDASLEEPESADGFVHISEKIPPRRILPGDANLAQDSPQMLRELMINCSRGLLCASSTARLLFLQGQHAQGPYDSWAIDNFRVTSNGGVVSNTQIVCRTPSSPLASISHRRSLVNQSNVTVPDSVPEPGFVNISVSSILHPLICFCCESLRQAVRIPWHLVTVVFCNI